MMHKICVAIPCLNEEASVANVIQKVFVALNAYSPTILLVDDGSTDSTAEVGRRNQAIVISHAETKGVSQTFQTAINFALSNSFDVLCTIDGDGQFDPEDLVAIVSPILHKSYDVVTGSRFMNGQIFPVGIDRTRMWGNLTMAFLVSTLVGRRFYDVACGMRAYNRESLYQINLFGQFTYTQEILIDLSFKNLRISEVPVKVQYFEGRRSRVFKGVFNYALRSLPIIIRGFRDHKPLLLFSGSGLIFSAIASFGLFYFFNIFFESGFFRGYLWLGLISASILFFGLILISVGLILDMTSHIKITEDRALVLHKKMYFRSKQETVLSPPTQTSYNQNSQVVN